MAEPTLEDVMRAVTELRREMQAEIAELRATLAEVQAHKAKVEAREPSTETVAIIAAAVTAFLGVKVRIRSARLVHAAHETANPWAQHGRVFVQGASHNLRHVR